MIANAHIVTGGMGFKADYEAIVPLCDGHHFMLHNIGRITFERTYRVDLEKLAAETEAAWQDHLNAQEKIA